jgi:molecular chaperone IbpA
MTSKSLSIFNQLRPVTVGFDPIFDRFERMFEDDFFSAPMVNYPPYNIVKTGDYTYDIELALAGFNKKDIDVSYEDGVVTVKTIHETSEESQANGSILHRGISKRQFTKAFQIADDVEVRGAELKDGLLKISLERIIPESRKPRSIEVK